MAIDTMRIVGIIMITKDTESKRKMDDSMKEYTSDIIRNLTEMWSDADATLRQSMKADLTRFVQQMN